MKHTTDESDNHQPLTEFERHRAIFRQAAPDAECQCRFSPDNLYKHGAARKVTRNDKGKKIIKFFDRVPKEYHHDAIFRGYARFRQRRHQMQEAAEKKKAQDD